MIRTSGGGNRDLTMLAVPLAMLIAYALFSVLRRSEAPAPFSTKDLIGDDAFVSVGIPAGRYGSVLVKKEGQTHEFSATSSNEVPAGTTARVTGVAGSGLIVEPVPATGGPAAVTADQGGSQGA